MRCDIKKLFKEAKTDEDEINKLEKKLSELNDDIKELKKERDALKGDVKWSQKLLDVIKEIKNYDDKLKEDTIFKEMVSSKVVDIIKKSRFSKIKGNIEIRVEKYRKYFDYKNNKEKLNSLSSVSDKEDDFLEKYKEELKELKDKRDKQDEVIKEANKTIEKKKEKLEELNKFNGNHFLLNMDLKTLKETKENNEEEMDELSEKIFEEKKKIERVDELKKREKELDKNIDKYEDKIKELNKEISVMEHLEEEYLKLMEEEKLSSAVRDVLRIHLPVKVIDSFLETVKVYTNQFLENSGLPYRVSNFEITDKIFRIETTKFGRVYEDVSNMSKGEKALISLSISFAKHRVVSSLSDYRIIALDEVDSYLKQEKKEIFKDIVLSQKDAFNLNQIFIVTHNENFTKMSNVSHVAFDKSNVDPYSDNKRILYHYEKD